MIGQIVSATKSVRGLFLSAAVLGLTLVMGGQAQAQVSFTVNGQTFTTGSFTQFPAGNAIAVGGQTAVNNTPIGGTSVPFTVLFQSEVFFANAATGSPIVPSPGFFTMVGSFQETATRTAANAINLNLAAGTNTFQLYFSPTGTAPNNFAGTGFTPAGGLIFAGNIVASAGNFSVTGGAGNFDTTNPGLVGNKQAVQGNGSTTLNVQETAFNQQANIFNTNLTGTSINLTISTQTQFTTGNGVDPSQMFFNGVTPVLPTVNGALTTPAEIAAAAGGQRFDIQFQSNGSGSFLVPEPASVAMTLLGLAGAGLGAFVSKRRKLAA